MGCLFNNGNNCSWIIILIIIWLVCGNNGCGNNGCVANNGCGNSCGNDCGCNCGCC